MAFDEIRENLRREATKDAKYFRSMPYFFELVVPTEVGGNYGTNYLFPLVLNPTDISMDEEFSVSESEAQGGGLFVEENGIIRRRMTLRGTTGFKPRPFRGSYFTGLQTPERRSYNRMNADAHPLESLSGHRHFQFLQDAVFRTYADLKRDPSTSRDTRLLFHNPKDDEHWMVVPTRFSMERSAGSRTRTTYDYHIELLVVDKADANDEDFSEDKSVLDSIKDGLRAAKNFVDAVTATIRDVTQLIGELVQFVKDIGKILNGFVDLVSSVGDFISGVGALIRAPIDTLTGLIVGLDAAIANILAATDSVPDGIINSMRKLNDAAHALAAHPEVFISESQATLESVQRASQLTTSRTRAQLVAAQSTEITSLRQAAKLGTANLPGDLERSRTETSAGRATPKFQSAKEYEVTSTDTLQNLAARFLGDARLWRHIATINNLKAPFISEAGLPNTVGKGAKILIPSFATAPQAQAVQAVLGVEREAELRERLLGVDYTFEEQPIPGRLFDFEIDFDHGAVDLKMVRGVDCLKQGCQLRLTTEQGTATMYRKLGMLRIIGTKIPIVDTELLRFRIGQAISVDPRIAAVKQVNLPVVEGESADTLSPEIWAEVRGLAGTQTFSLE